MSNNIFDILVKALNERKNKLKRLLPTRVDREADGKRELDYGYEELEKDPVKDNEVEKEEKLEGGLADGKPDSKYDAKQLEMGIEVEFEHTNDRDIAKEIAKDHLEEIPDYYTRLKNMEDKAKEEGKFKKSMSEAWEELKKQLSHAESILNIKEEQEEDEEEELDEEGEAAEDEDVAPEEIMQLLQQIEGGLEEDPEAEEPAEEELEEEPMLEEEGFLEEEPEEDPMLEEDEEELSIGDKLDEADELGEVEEGLMPERRDSIVSPDDMMLEEDPAEEGLEEDPMTAEEPAAEEPAEEEPAEEELAEDPMAAEEELSDDEKQNRLIEALKEEGYSDLEIAHIVHGYTPPQVDPVDQAKIETYKAKAEAERSAAMRDKGIKETEAQVGSQIRLQEAHADADHKQKINEIELRDLMRQKESTKIKNEHTKRLLDLEYEHQKKLKELEVKYKEEELALRLQNRYYAAKDHDARTTKYPIRSTKGDLEKSDKDMERNKWEYNPKTKQFNHPKYGSVMVDRDDKGYHFKHKGNIISTHADKKELLGNVASYMKQLKTRSPVMHDIGAKPEVKVDPPKFPKPAEAPAERQPKEEVSSMFGLPAIKKPKE